MSAWVWVIGGRFPPEWRDYASHCRFCEVPRLMMPNALADAHGRWVRQVWGETRWPVATTVRHFDA